MLKQTLKPAVKRILAFGLPDWPVLHGVYRGLYRFGRIVFEVGQWVKKVLWVEPVLRAVAESVGARLRIERVPYICGQGTIRIGDDVYVSGKINIGFNAKIGLNPTLSVGDGTFIGHNCSFNLADGVSIGDHCLIAAGSRFYDNDGHPFDAETRRRNEPVAAENVKPITVGHDVWIGNSVMVLKGVTIGDRAIVAAASVVTKDVPPDTVVAGNPATVRKQLPVNL